MNSPEEYIKEHIKGYDKTIPGNVFYDICTAIAHQNDMSLEEATKIFYKNIGTLQVGEVLNQGVGKDNLWDGQDKAVAFSYGKPGFLAEPMSSLKAPICISSKDYEHGSKLPLAPGDLIVPELRTNAYGDLFQLAESVFEDERLAKYPNKPSRLTSTYMTSPDTKENWVPDKYHPVDTSKAKVHDTDAQWIDAAEHVLYDELVVMREENGLAETHPKFRDVNFIDDKERNEFLKTLWGSDIEKVVRGYADKYWEGVVTPTVDAEGPVSRPESLGEGKVTLKKVAFKVGDEVRVKKNEQAPWGAEYTGVIEKINKDNTLDIRDIDTGTLNTSQPSRLLAVPMGDGRPDLRIQQRRVGDPKGMGESAGDVGGHEVKQDYPNANWEPQGHAGQEVKNPQSMFYKEGDKLLTFLLTSIAKESGTTSATEVKNYLDGKISSPSRSLKEILRKYNIVAAVGEPMLNVEKALGEVKGKSEIQINTETAWTWGSRAAASYKLSNETNDPKEKEKWVRLGDAYRHESLEHASLVEDEGKLVGEVYRALAPFRKPAGTPEK
jgi:hypothetical protein